METLFCEDVPLEPSVPCSRHFSPSAWDPCVSPDWSSLLDPGRMDMVIPFGCPAAELRSHAQGSPHLGRRPLPVTKAAK
jgi:hypothetical protein